MKTLSHEEVHARLMDLVYGEASPNLLAPLQAHVAGCAECKAEVAALGDTRARVRAALDDAPVPPGAHARILEAAAAATAADASSRAAAKAAGATATAAAAANGAGAQGATPAGAAARAPKMSAAGGPSFWERMRGKWTFPTLATAGALALMLIGSKVFMNPERTLERGKEGLLPHEAPPEPAPPPSAETTPAAPAPGEGALADKREPEKEQAADQPHGSRPLSPAAKAAIERVRAFGPGPASGLFGHSKVSDRLAGGTASRAMGGVGVGGGSVGAGSVGSVGNLGNLGTTGGKGSVAAAKQKAPADNMAAERGGYASPPSGWKGGAASASARPAAAPAPAVRRASKRDVSDNALDGLAANASRGRADDREQEAKSEALEEGRAEPVARSLAKKKSISAQEAPAQDEARPAPVARSAAPSSSGPVVASSRPAAASPPPPAAPSPPAARSAEPQADLAEATSSKEAPAKSAREKDSAPGGAPAPAPTFATLARRADELYAAHRWSEAAVAYRELLRRYPDADPAPRWRTRLAQAQREVAPREAPAATSAPAEK